MPVRMEEMAVGGAAGEVRVGESRGVVVVGAAALASNHAQEPGL